MKFFNLTILIALLALCERAFSQHTKASEEFVGEDTRVIDNNRDIYDPKNDFIREDMKKSAVLDAVEKGVFIKMRGGNSMFKEAFNRNATESNFENYVSTLLQKYNLKWRRNSDFEFTLQDKRKWRVMVKGVIDETSDSSAFDKQWDSRSLYEGRSIKVLANHADIYDSKNDVVRDQMKQAAIFDAIEKMVNIDISGQNKSVLNSVALNKGENISVDYASSLLEKYQIMWKRASSYQFEKLDKRKWAVKVSGIIINAPNEVWAKDETFEHQKTFIVESKRFNHVRVNVGYKDVPYAQKQLIIYGVRKAKKASGGTENIRKPKAFLHITQQDEFLASAKIIKGTWSVNVRDVVEIDYFNLKRHGFKYEISIPSESFIQAIREKYIGNINVWGHAFSYFHQNQFTNFGWTIGYKYQSFNFSDTANGFAHIPNFGLYYNWNLIPDVLFISPELNIGYMVLGGNDELKKSEMTPLIGDKSATLEGKISLGIRLGPIDLLAGYSYQYILSTANSKLNSLYPFVGIKIHLSKYK